jgi:hypothetical protein
LAGIGGKTEPKDTGVASTTGWLNKSDMAAIAQ